MQSRDLVRELHGRVASAATRDQSAKWACCAAEATPEAAAEEVMGNLGERGQGGVEWLCSVRFVRRATRREGQRFVLLGHGHHRSCR